MAEYERKALDDLLSRFSRTESAFAAVRELVDADGPDAQAAVVQRHPEVTLDRWDAGVSVLVQFAMLTGLVTILPRLQELQGWLRGRR